MTSSASVALALGLAAGLPAPGGLSLPVPGALATRVAARIAEQWGVPAGGIALEWGRTPADMSLAPEGPFRLAGRGLDGRWIVVFEAATSATAVRVRAGVVSETPVAARALVAGSTLAASDIRTEPLRHWGPPPAHDQPLPSAGWRVRRALAEGEPLAWPAVSAPAWIAAGEPLALGWDRGGVRVSLQGTALNAAGAGEAVRARANGRSLPLAGLMVAPGVASLGKGGPQ